MTAATLHQVSTGRFVLGLGASTSALTEGFHDIPFEHPAARLRDTVTKVRALLDGQPAQLDHGSSARPLRLGQPPAPEVPIWVAALGEHTTRVAAEAGDGWIPFLVARDSLPAWRAQLNGLREVTEPRGRTLTIATGPITVAGDDAGQARDIAASCTAWYLTAMGDVYARSVSGQGYAAEVKEIIAANPRPTRGAGSSRTTPGPSSARSPPAEPATRSGNSSRPGTTPPTWSRSSCPRGCPGRSSRRPCWPRRQVPDDPV
jgi:alkanesulfonate monooxygenase SsuD/methylene tetrahydromethanopterin reductase-like flavin-dependent oxidoreductase (luciferase family)